MQITGVIKTIKDTQQVTDTFKKREFVLTDNSGKYEQHILFQATQDRTATLDRFKAGDRVQLDFDIRGREWKAPDGELKYFVSLEAWRIETLGQTAGGDAQRPPVAEPAVPFDSGNDDPFSSKEEDDLPF